MAGQGVAVSTARAGNVIGGGYFAKDRIMPDCVRAVIAGKTIQVRNPYSVRPYQHVLEALSAYLLIAQRQYEDENLAGSYNVGPQDEDCITTGVLVDMFCSAWGDGASWENTGNGDGPHEDAVLKLAHSKIRGALGWSQKWDVKQAVAETVEWTKAWRENKCVLLHMNHQISEYLR